MRISHLFSSTLVALLISGCAPKSIPQQLATKSPPQSIVEIAFDDHLTVAVDVNDFRQVTGSYYDELERERGFLWEAENGFTDLGSLGGDRTSPFAINNKGQIVGMANTAQGHTRAFLWSAEEGMKELGTLGGDSNRAHDINNQGQVVGESYLGNGRYHAFFYSPDTGMQDLGALQNMDSTAEMILESGKVLGSHISLDAQEFFFIWDPKTGRQDLSLEDRFADFQPDSLTETGELMGYSTLHGAPMLFAPNGRPYNLGPLQEYGAGSVIAKLPDGTYLAKVNEVSDIDSSFFRFSQTMPPTPIPLQGHELSAIKEHNALGDILLSARDSEGKFVSLLVRVKLNPSAAGK